VSVQRSQSSVKPGQQAAYTVQVSTENNGSAANVSVALVAQPSSQKPTFTSGCAKGDGTAGCTVSSVSDKQPADLHAQIPVASGATSVKLTATASIVTSVKWTPPSASQTVAVTAAASASPAKSSAKSSASGSSPETTTLPLGPIPNLNAVSSSLIGAGNASSLFPAIIPSATPNSSPGIQPQVGRRDAEPVSDSSALGLGKPGLTGQVAGLIALALAIMFTVTRLSLRKRFKKAGK
jgi:hypothetical protein